MPLLKPLSIDSFIRVARSFVGQREIGHNGGPFVTKILAKVGLGPGWAWCAAFVSDVFEEAGVEGIGPKKGRAAVQNWSTWAWSLNIVKLAPKAGDLFYWLHPDGKGHMGIVTEVTILGGGKIEIKAVSGNTNTKGSREGDGVYEQEFLTSDRPGIRFIRWALVA